MNTRRISAGQERLSRAEQRAEGLLERIAQTDRVLNKRSVADKDLILVLGNTGAGKSTFVNYMMNRRMVEVQDDRTGDTKIDCENPVAKIGHSQTSETLLPEVFYDSKSSLAFCDCPGFGDNRGVEVEIANMYGIATLARSARSMRAVVFLVSFQALQDKRGQSLSDAVAMLSTIFGDRWTDPAVLSNVLLLVTGAEDDGRLKRHIRAKLSDVARELQTVPMDLANRAEAYDPLDSTEPELERLRRTAIVTLLQGYRGMPAAQDLAFALSSDSQLRLIDLMDALETQARDKFTRQRFSEVREILERCECLEVLNCSCIEEKRTALLEHLQLQVGEWSAQDDKLEVLRHVEAELHQLAKAAKKAINGIEARQAERKRQQDVTLKAELSLKEERYARADSERRRDEDHARYEKDIKKLGDEMKQMKVRAEQQAMAAPPPQSPIILCGGMPGMMGGMSGPQTPDRSYQSSMDFHASPRQSFGCSSVSSSCSTSSRARSNWDTFRTANKDKGWTRQQMSNNYQASKRR